MVAVPAAIVFVNNDLVDQVRDHLKVQLHINEIIDGYVFDDRLAADSEYICKVKQLNLRIMVIRPFTELESRENADVAIFIKNGMAAILKNNFGPPGATYKVVDLHWGQLCIFNTSFPNNC